MVGSAALVRSRTTALYRLLKKHFSLVWWHTPVIRAPCRLRQEDSKFQDRLTSIMRCSRSSR